jgi:hypothetical protein
VTIPFTYHPTREYLIRSGVIVPNPSSHRNCHTRKVKVTYRGRQQIEYMHTSYPADKSPLQKIADARCGYCASAFPHSLFLHDLCVRKSEIADTRKVAA